MADRPDSRFAVMTWHPPPSPVQESGFYQDRHQNGDDCDDFDVNGWSKLCMQSFNPVYRPFSTEMNFLGNETLGPLIDSRYHKDGFLQIFKGTISNHRTHTICTEKCAGDKND